MNDPVHFKSLANADRLGRRTMRLVEDVESLSNNEFPAPLESRLDGLESMAEA